MTSFPFAAAPAGRKAGARVAERGTARTGMSLPGSLPRPEGVHKAVVPSPREASVFATYVVVTLLTAAVSGLAAVANLTGHDYPASQADKLRVPRSWMRPLGVVLAAASLGLLGGFAVPVLGTLAAAGLVLYFVCALCAHLRVGDNQLGPWSAFFCLSAAALATGLAHQVT